MIINSSDPSVLNAYFIQSYRGFITYYFEIARLLPHVFKIKYFEEVLGLDYNLTNKSKSQINDVIFSHYYQITASKRYIIKVFI